MDSEVDQQVSLCPSVDHFLTVDEQFDWVEFCKSFRGPIQVESGGPPSLIFANYLLWAHEKIVQSGHHNFEDARIPIPSGLTIRFFYTHLKDYWDSRLLDMLLFGWPLGSEGSILCSIQYRNHQGATQFVSDISRYIHKQSQVGRILGPFNRNPLSSVLAYSPLNSVPKRDSQERRVISDLSFPVGNSVNDLIPRDTYLGSPTNLRFPSVDDLVDIIRIKGPGCALFKRDLRQAYRQIPVDPGDFNLLGFHWLGKIYIDRSLIMGQRSAAFCCQSVSNAIVYIYKKFGFSLVAYIDDLASAESWDKASTAFDCLGWVLQSCGIEESVAKACSPSTRMTFLGIQIDTVTMTLEVTEERLVEIRELTASWLNKASASRHEVESIVGKLNFVATCVRPGRVFISRMLNFLRGLSASGKHAIPPDFTLDVKWWNVFLESYNGISMLPTADWSHPDQVFACDACLSGCGAWTEELEYFHSEFPQFIQDLKLHINALELLTIVVSCKVWGRRWSGLKIKIFCDNDATVSVIASGRSRDPFMQSCLRELVFIASQHEFEIRAVHLPGEDNRLPDLLSRWCLGDRYAKEFHARTDGLRKKEIFVFQGLFQFAHDW